jgi:type VI protein secretion system component VasF
VVDIQAKAKESADLSQQAQASAQAALKDVGTRRIGMYAALVAILVTVVALILIKRELDRNLQAERARRNTGASGPHPD